MPAAPADARHVAQLVKDLDSENFSTRERATAELKDLRDLAEPALRKLAEGKPSLEVQRRAERLLQALDQWWPEELRALRAIEALEHMDSPDAEKLLKALATGSPAARVTREAAASLTSLGQRHVALGKAVAAVRVWGVPR